MIKKFVIGLLLFLGMVPFLVNASAGAAAKVGGKYYDSLEDAIANASSTDTIVLMSDANLDETIQINKTVNIDLNGRKVTAPSTIFLVEGGTLNVSGPGTIKETEPNYGAIMVKGNTDPVDGDYSVVNVDEDVTLEGWSGVFVGHNTYNAYGVVVNLDGKVNAVNDVNGGTGIGVYVNGNIKHKDDSPVVNISDNAEITSTGNGLYMAGYSTFNIGKANISGVESGIGIKAGILNIDGATIVCTGEDETPTEGYTNGIKASGTAIQIESNNGYAGDIELNIKSGNLKSKNSNVIYEYIGRGDDSLVKSIDLTGGTYVSETNKDVIRTSNSFATKHPSFITGGKYSSNPSSYLESGYTATLDDGLYTVTKSTMSASLVNGTSGSADGGFGKILITLVVIITVGVIGYFNKDRILSFIK